MLTTRKVLLFVLVLLLVTLSTCQRSRSKRYLVFPEGSEVELAAGFDLPIEVPGGGEVGLGLELKVVTEMPSNASELTGGYVTYARLLHTRWHVYYLLEALLDRLGVDGRACMLRTVCDVAGSHLVRDAGLSAEILHVLLTPSSTDEVQGSGGQVQREYSSAERLGNQREVDCAVLYPECRLGLLEMVSREASLLG